jgi:hypothetical protein
VLDNHDGAGFLLRHDFCSYAYRGLGGEDKSAFLHHDVSNQQFEHDSLSPPRNLRLAMFFGNADWLFTLAMRQRW